MTLPFDIKSIQPLSQNIPQVQSEWSMNDYLGTIKVRWGIGRDHYSVSPGLYKIGSPNSESDVFVSANYKLSFDLLRKNLKDLNAWILAIDTKGVNVWCAAGKGTFSTNNIVKSIKETGLELLVKHKRLILPQLGAPGVSAHLIKEQTGFSVNYGPVKAQDIKAYLKAGYKASLEMRRINFNLWDRAKLIPVDFMYGKYRLLIALFVIFVLSGMDKTGFLFSKMISTSLFPLLAVGIAYFAGIVLTPLLLPWIPFKSFSLKGAVVSLGSFLILYKIFNPEILEASAILAIAIAIASFTAMNFTGSSTFTSLSGVKKEMKWAIPFQISFVFIGIVAFITSKLS